MGGSIVIEACNLPTGVICVIPGDWRMTSNRVKLTRTQGAINELLSGLTAGCQSVSAWTP